MVCITKKQDQDFESQRCKILEYYKVISFSLIFPNLALLQHPLKILDWGFNRTGHTLNIHVVNY